MASVTWIDSDGTAVLTNEKPAPADKFNAWTPKRSPIGPRSVRLGSGRTDAFVFRTDDLIAFQLDAIPGSEDNFQLMMRLEAHLVTGGLVLLDADPSAWAPHWAIACIAPETEGDIQFSDRQMLEYSFVAQLKAVEPSSLTEGEFESLPPTTLLEGDCLTPNRTTFAATSGLSSTRDKGDDFSDWDLDQYEDFRDDTVSDPNYENGTRSLPYTTHPLASDLPGYFFELFDDTDAEFPYTPPVDQPNRNRISQLAVNGGHRTLKAIKTSGDLDSLFNGFEIWPADTGETKRYESLWARLRFQYSSGFPLGSASDTDASFGGVYLFSAQNSSPSNDITVATGTLTNPSSKLTVAHEVDSVVIEEVLGDVTDLVTTGTPRELVVYYGRTFDELGTPIEDEYRVAVWMGPAFGTLTKLYDETQAGSGIETGRQMYFMRSKNVYHVPEDQNVICYECIEWEIEDGDGSDAGTFDPYGLDGFDPDPVFATWNPSDKAAGITLSDGNLTSDGSDGGTVRATQGKSSGKWYWEVTVGTPGEKDVGIADSLHDLSFFCGGTSHSWGYYGGDGEIYHNDPGTAYGATFTDGDIISVALDMDNGKVFFAKNGTWQNSGDPAAGTGAAFTGLSGAIYPCIGGGDNGVATVNFGATSFTHTPPTGFVGVST